MTEAEWLDLLAKKLPEELTKDELAQLREQCLHSVAVRAAVAAALQVDTDLAAGLSELPPAIDQLFERATARTAVKARSGPAWWLWIGLAAAALLVAIIAWNFAPPLDPQLAHRPVTNDGLTEAPTNPSQTESVGQLTETMPPQTRVAQSGTAQTGTPTNPQNAATATGVALFQPDDPWAKWFDGTQAPLAADHPGWRADLKTMGLDEIPLAEWQRWWREAPKANWQEQIVSSRRTISIQGRMALQAPFVDDAVLRLIPFDVQELAFLFWNGDRGVGLRYFRHRQPQTWAAFEITRSSNQAEPQWGALLTTDNGSIDRSGCAVLELRRQADQLMLAVGQIPVLSVPLTQPLQEVELAGHTRLRGFQWSRAEAWPVETHESGTAVFDERPVRDWGWGLGQPDAGMLQLDEDGAVRLTGADPKEETLARCFLPIPRLVETSLQITSADAGTGVFLGDADGKPLVRLGVMQDRRTQRLALGPLRATEKNRDVDYDPNASPPPYWGPTVRLKLVAGMGTFQAWASADGAHWGRLFDGPLRDINGAVRSIGLYCLPGETPRSIHVSHWDVRELSGLSEWLPGRYHLPSEAPAPKSEAAWMSLALEETKPDRPWSAIALAALECGTERNFGRTLLARITESPEFAQATLLQQSRFRCDALKLYDLASDQDTGPLFRALLPQTGDTTDVTRGWREWVTLAAPTSDVGTSSYARMLTAVLQHAAFLDDRPRLTAALREIDFWFVRAHPDQRPSGPAEVAERLARWGRGWLGSAAGLSEVFGDGVLPIGWRHPLQLSINKEAYNIQAELASALTGAAYKDACRITMSFGPEDASGLMPDPVDERLFVALPVALASAVTDHPEFGQTLLQETGPTGLLRVQQAAERGDWNALHAATLQFFGTPAAAEAERLLGDRQMALGVFPLAWRHYLRASAIAGPNAADLAARAAVAAALMPQRISDPAATPAALQLSGQPVAPLVQEFAAAALPPLAPQLPGILETGSLPRNRIKFEPLGRFDGQVGQNAGRGEYRESDPFGRQFAVAIDAQSVYISNRFQVTAYDRQNGQPRWGTAVGSEQGDAHGHRFVPMVPYVVGDDLWVRRLTKAGVELACLNARTGELKWRTRGGEKSDVLSEPLLLPDGLGVLVSHRQDDDQLEVRWTRLDRQSGRMLTETPLVRFRDVWGGEIPCQLNHHQFSAVASLGGTVIGFDVQGELRWVRRETWLPPKIDPRIDDFLSTPPAILPATETTPTLAVVTLSSSRSVIGLEAETGRVRWRKTFADLEGLLGITQDQVLVATPSKLLALNGADGELRWQRSLAGRLTAHAFSAGSLVVAQEQDVQNQKDGLQLVWINPREGSIDAVAPVDAPVQAEWRVGPMFAVGDKWWVLAGSGAVKPQRELFLATPELGSVIERPVDPELSLWFPTVAADRTMSQVVLPGWQPVLPIRGMLQFSKEPVRGRAPVLVARSTKPSETVRWVRTVAVPQGTSLQLFGRVGNQSGESWQWRVRVNGRTLLDQPVTDQTTADGWLERTVPLGDFAGQTVLIEITQDPPEGKGATCHWHELRLVGQ